MRIGNVRGRAVLLVEDGLGIDVAEASSNQFGPAVTDLYPVWSDFAAWAGDARAAAAVTSRVEFAASDLQAPSPEPRQIFAVGLNYLDHALEAGFAVPTEPAVFTKFVSSITGPETVVTLPNDQVDWEVELVAVIGRGGRDIPIESAWDHIAGLTVGQDLSERRLQMVGAVPQFSLAKSYEGFSPTGPYLVTPDELADPADLELSCTVNGEEVQKSRTSQLVFPIDALIAKLSAVTMLYPGDVIFTGTPSGVGVARDPRRFLAAGDVLVSTIEGIGEIRQTLVAKES